MRTVPSRETQMLTLCPRCLATSALPPPCTASASHWTPLPSSTWTHTEGGSPPQSWPSGCGETSTSTQRSEDYHTWQWGWGWGWPRIHCCGAVMGMALSQSLWRFAAVDWCLLIIELHSVAHTPLMGHALLLCRRAGCCV